MRSKLLYRILHNSFWLFLLQGSAQIMPIFIIPHLIRNLGISNYGIYSYFSSVGLYLLTIVNYGFDITAVSELLKKPKEYLLVSKVVFSKLLLSLVTLLISVPIFLLFNQPTINLYYVHVFIGIQIISAAFNLDWFFLGQSWYKIYSLFNAGLKILFCVLVIFFIKNNVVENVIFFETFTYFFFVICIFILTINKLKISIKFPSKQDLLFQLKNGFKIFFTRICLSVVSNGNVILIGLLLTSKDVGEFASADKLIVFILGVSSVLCKSLLPIQTEYYLKGAEKYSKFSNNVMMSLFTSMMLVSIVLGFYSTFFIQRIFKINNTNVYQIFKILILYTPFFSVGAYLTNSFVIQSQQKLMMRPFFEIVVINLSLSIITINYYGIIGAGYSVCISWIFLIVRLFLIHQKL